MTFEIGDKVGDYEVIGVLGAGQMGKVYKVRNLISDRVEAMKVLLPNLTDEPTLADRFVREIKALASLDHPNIAALNTALRIGNQLVMIMEYVEGTTLRDLLCQGRIPLPEGIDYMCQALAALGYAHGKEIIHRDIKPGNMIRTPLRTIKLMDFGIAKTPAEGNLTRPGTIMGSPYYMSPEQVMGTNVDARSDLYSIGLCLYEITTGARPFRANSDYELMETQLRKPPRPPIELDPNVPSALNDIILQALEKDPAKRFQTAEEFRAALLGVMSNQGGTRPHGWIESLTDRRGLYLAVGAVLAIVLLVVLDIELPNVLNHRRRARTQSVKEQSRGRNRPSPLSPDFPGGSMVLVEGGPAKLGKDRLPVNVPSFYIDRTEVTNQHFLEFCQATKRTPPPGAELQPRDNPVVNVTFADAQAFCDWVGQRLPSADEWEKAARGTDGRTYPWGNTLDYSRANIPKDKVAAKSAELAPATAYESGASIYGALNMLGNAWEWVNTRDEAPTGLDFKDYQQNEFPSLQPPLSPTEPYYQTRGGSFKYVAKPKALIWDSSPIPARAHERDIGFRCAKDPST